MDNFSTTEREIFKFSTSAIQCLAKDKPCLKQGFDCCEFEFSITKSGDLNKGLINF